MIDANKLRKEAKSKKLFEKECFNKILNMCLNKVDIVSKTGIDKTWFEIPKFLLGYPTYEIGQVAIFLNKELKKLNFNSWMAKENIIVIDWSIED